MILAAHQPQFMPWLGYFAKISQSDMFVIMDDVQYKKNEYQNRNKIKTSQGPHWLTVPVQHRLGQTIREIKINHEVNWREKTLKMLNQSYSQSPFYKLYRGDIESIIRMDCAHLAELNNHCIKKLCDIMEIRTKMVYSSTLAVDGKSTERLVNICRQSQATSYLSGSGGKNYLDTELFEKAGIELIFQEYQHPRYPQLYGEFVPHLSVIDLLFNCGPDSRDVMLNKKKS